MGTIKCINICIMGVPEGEDKEEQKPYFKKWPKTIPKFNKGLLGALIFFCLLISGF